MIKDIKFLQINKKTTQQDQGYKEQAIHRRGNANEQ